MDEIIKQFLRFRFPFSLITLIRHVRIFSPPYLTVFTFDRVTARNESCPGGIDPAMADKLGGWDFV